MKKKIFTNSVWLFSDKVLRLFLGLAVSVYMARSLGVTFVGQWSYIESLYGIFLILVTLGLDSIVVKELINNPDKKNKVLGSAFVMKICGAVSLIVLTQLLLIFMSNGENLKVAILFLSLSSLFQSIDVIDYFFRANYQSKFTVLSKTASFVIVSGLRLYLIYIECSIELFALTYIVEYFIYTLFMLKLYFSKGKSKIFDWEFDKDITINILYSSFPLVIASFAIMVQARIDQIMIAQFLGEEVLAQYSVALRLIEVLGFIPVVLANSFSPAVANAKLKNIDLYDSTLINLYKIMFICFLIIAVPLYFISEYLVIFLYGDDFKEAGALLSLFAIRLFFTNFGVARSVFIVNEGLFRHTLTTSLIGAMTNILLNLVLIPAYGSKGAIIATIISFSISIFILDLLNKITRKNLKLIFTALKNPFKFN